MASERGKVLRVRNNARFVPIKSWGHSWQKNAVMSWYIRVVWRTWRMTHTPRIRVFQCVKTLKGLTYNIIDPAWYLVHYLNLRENRFQLKFGRVKQLKLFTCWRQLWTALHICWNKVKTENNSLNYSKLFVYITFLDQAFRKV